MEIELSISRNYVCNWGLKEAIRELLQNAIDAEKEGFSMCVGYNGVTETLSISSIGAHLDFQDLVLGNSIKNEDDQMIGKYGEGFKLALVVLLREGYEVFIENRNKLWTPYFSKSDVFNIEVLKIKEEDLDDNNGLNFVVRGVDEDTYKELKRYFPCIDNDYGEIVETQSGSILLDDRFHGKMFIEGLYIQSDNNFKYGYNFHADVVNLDRDRRAINYYELRKLTATSIVTAEECNPKIFSAISNSCTDVKDILEVIDDASQEFLEEYRDMFYAERELEENTLVATESVIKQIKQIDADVPVVKGTEVESYLIAKANDKLGLLFEAQNAAKAKNEIEDAWDSLPYTNWFDLKCWYDKYKVELSENAKKNFVFILNNMIPSYYMMIKDSIPEDFIWSVDNFEKLKDQI